MTLMSDQKSLPAIGFLTITRDAEHGLFGGYLVLNALGRPLEFHCTAPVRPSRAQEILYGPTLEPYLYGERIGPTLLEKSRCVPLAVFTDVEPAMAARPFVSTPLLLVLTAERSTGLSGQAELACGVHGGQSLRAASGGTMTDRRADAAHPPRRGHGSVWESFALGGYSVACAATHPQDGQAVRGSWSQFADQIDLDEPFGRIRDAIDEARNSAR